MSKGDDILVCFLLLCSTVLVSASADAATAEKMQNSCVHCHAQLPGSSFIGVKSHDWKGSIHQKHDVTCDKCHGGNPGASDEKEAHAGVFGSGNPQSTVYYKNIPSTCGKCHGAELYNFTQSFHYKRLEATGKGPDCVTCHGSMVTTILTPDTIAAVCERCHNDRMAVFPYVPQKAKAVLLLLRESNALFASEKKLYHAAGGTAKARSLSEAQASLSSAKLDWHKFDLDAITGHLQDVYNSLIKLDQENSHQ
jgi:hypothetical protein